ncbi:MAG TPA: hypothetical protein VF576_12855 [Rubricoccaceae bacterium]|jgi:hypothetical protein
MSAPPFFIQVGSTFVNVNQIRSIQLEDDGSSFVNVGKGKGVRLTAQATVLLMDMVTLIELPTAG